MQVNLIGELLVRTILFNAHELQRATSLRRGQSRPLARARLGFMTNFHCFENKSNNSQNKTYYKIWPTSQIFDGVRTYTNIEKKKKKTVRTVRTEDKRPDFPKAARPRYKGDVVTNANASGLFPRILNLFAVHLFKIAINYLFV